MNRMMKRTMTICTMALALVLTPGAFAQDDAPGNSGNAPGQANAKGNINRGHGNAKNGVKAIIHTNSSVLYTGEEGNDALEVSVRFPRGASLLENGEVDAWLMVFDPEAGLDSLPLSSEVSDDSKNLFALDPEALEELPDGMYQLGVVLTVPDGDPTNLEDWYNGLLGLVSVRGLTISSEPLDVDENGDGEVDDDADGDGIADGGDDTEEESTDDSTDGGTTSDE